MTYPDMLSIANPTKEERQRHVDETNENLRKKGIEASAELVDLQRQYIEGERSVMDLLDYGLALIRSIGKEFDPSAPTDFH